MTVAPPFPWINANTISGKLFFLMNLPYYLAGKLPEYLEWFVQQKG